MTKFVRKFIFIALLIGSVSGCSDFELKGSLGTEEEKPQPKEENPKKDKEEEVTPPTSTCDGTNHDNYCPQKCSPVSDNVNYDIDCTAYTNCDGAFPSPHCTDTNASTLTDSYRITKLEFVSDLTTSSFGKAILDLNEPKKRDDLAENILTNQPFPSVYLPWAKSKITKTLSKLAIADTKDNPGKEKEVQLNQSIQNDMLNILLVFDKDKTNEGSTTELLIYHGEKDTQSNNYKILKKWLIDNGTYPTSVVKQIKFEANNTFKEVKPQTILLPMALKGVRSTLRLQNATVSAKKTTNTELSNGVITGRLEWEDFKKFALRAVDQCPKTYNQKNENCDLVVDLDAITCQRAPTFPAQKCLKQISTVASCDENKDARVRLCYGSLATICVGFELMDPNTQKEDVIKAFKEGLGFTEDNGKYYATVKMDFEAEKVTISDTDAKTYGFCPAP